VARVVESYGDDSALAADDSPKVELGAGQLHAGTNYLTRQLDWIGRAANQLERANKKQHTSKIYN